MSGSVRLRHGLLSLAIVISPEVLQQESRSGPSSDPGKSFPQFPRGMIRSIRNRRRCAKDPFRDSKMFESPCYDAIVFNFGRPRTAGDWIVHIAGAIVAIFLVWWMLRVYVL